MYKLLPQIFFLSFISFVLFGQDKNPAGEGVDELIKKQLVKNDFAKIESFQKQEQNAMELMAEADRQYEEMAMIRQDLASQPDKKQREKLLKKSVKIERKAIINQIEALKNLSNVYVNIYEIYKKDLQKFSNSNFQDRVTELTDLQDKAYKCFENADLNVEKVYYTLNQNELFKLFTEAYVQERLGLLYQQKMYAIYLNFDPKIIEDIDERIASNLSNKPKEKDQNNTATYIKDSVNYTTIVVYDTVKVEKYIETNVVYKVQIAASKKLLNLSELRAIYKDESLIQYEIENDWYKYTIGFFSNYQDAANFKNIIGVQGAFIVAYRNGIKVPIKELTNDPSYKKSS